MSLGKGCDHRHPSDLSKIQVMDRKDYYDEEGGYEVEIWVETAKPLEEFETCLSRVIEPLEIQNHEFNLGGIDCSVQSIKDEWEIPDFAGVPKAEYSICVTVEKVNYSPWGAVDLHFAFAIAWGLRGKFSCRYLITANCNFFICHAGTNLPTYINTHYEPWASGELNSYRARNKKTIELYLPLEF